MSRPTLWALAGVAALAVAVIVFLPSSELPSSVVTFIRRELAQAGAPMWLRDADLWERLLNVALFVPVGVVLALLLRRWPLLGIVLLGAAASLAFELFQAYLLPDRDGSLWDVTTNTVGTAIGAGLVALTRGSVTWATPRR